MRRSHAGMPCSHLLHLDACSSSVHYYVEALSPLPPAPTRLKCFPPMMLVRCVPADLASTPLECPPLCPLSSPLMPKTQARGCWQCRSLWVLAWRHDKDRSLQEDVWFTVVKLSSQRTLRGSPRRPTSGTTMTGPTLCPMCQTWPVDTPSSLSMEAMRSHTRPTVSGRYLLETPASAPSQVCEGWTEYF